MLPFAYKMNTRELITGLSLLIVLAYILSPKPDSKSTQPDLQDYFEDYPLEYWKDTDEGGEIIWVRFRVLQDNTKLWVRDMAGRIVHETPMEFDLYDNGRDRVHKHRWKLYYTEWSQDISPGKYEIVVGSHLQNSTNLIASVQI